MRILHVTPTYWPAVRYGGPITSLRALAQAQRASGHDVRVLTTSVDGPNDLQSLEGLSQIVDGVSIRYFRAPAAFRRIYRSPAMSEHLPEAIAWSDIVHHHSVYLWPTWRSALVARQLGKPYVISPRGMLVRELIDAKNKWIKRIWIKLFEQANLQQARGIIVSSQHERERLIDLGLIDDPCRIHIVPHGVEVPNGFSSNEPRNRDVLYVGRLSWEKGIDTLLRAIRDTPDVRLTLAGTGDTAHYTRLASDMGIEHRVRWLGHVDQSGIHFLMSKAAMLVLPSLSENFGNVVVEAMATGCPVIVTSGVGAKDCVVEGDAGLVVENNPSSLADGIRLLLGNEVLRQRLGQNGRNYTAAHLTWRQISARAQVIYESCLARAG